MRRMVGRRTRKMKGRERKDEGREANENREGRKKRGRGMRWKERRKAGNNMKENNKKRTGKNEKYETGRGGMRGMRKMTIEGRGRNEEGDEVGWKARRKIGKDRRKKKRRKKTGRGR